MLVQATKKLKVSSIIWDKVMAELADKVPVDQRFANDTLPDFLNSKLVNFICRIGYGEDPGRGDYSAFGPLLEEISASIVIAGGVSSRLPVLGGLPKAAGTPDGWSVRANRYAFALLYGFRKLFVLRFKAHCTANAHKATQEFLEKMQNLELGLMDSTIATVLDFPSMASKDSVNLETLFTAKYSAVVTALVRVHPELKVREKKARATVVRMNEAILLSGRLMVANSTKKETWVELIAILKKVHVLLDVLILASPPWGVLQKGRLGSDSNDVALKEAEIKAYAKHSYNHLMDRGCVQVLNLPFAQAEIWAVFMAEYWTMKDVPLTFTKAGGWTKLRKGPVGNGTFQEFSSNTMFWFIFVRNESRDGTVLRAPRWTFDGARKHLHLTTKGVLALGVSGHLGEVTVHDVMVCLQCICSKWNSI